MVNARASEPDAMRECFGRHGNRSQQRQHDLCHPTLHLVEFWITADLHTDGWAGSGWLLTGLFTGVGAVAGNGVILWVPKATISQGNALGALHPGLAASTGVDGGWLPGPVSSAGRIAHSGRRSPIRQGCVLIAQQRLTGWCRRRQTLVRWYEKIHASRHRYATGLSTGRI
jgi:hypothetical protein